MMLTSTPPDKNSQKIEMESSSLTVDTLLLQSLVDILLVFNSQGQLLQGSESGIELMHTLRSSANENHWNVLPPDLVALCKKVCQTPQVECCEISLAATMYTLSIAPLTFGVEKQKGILILGRKTSLEILSMRLYARLAEYSSEISPMEAKVCQLICANESAKAVATDLHISENTVKFHIKNVRRKLGLSGQAGSLRQFLWGLQVPEREPKVAL